MSTIKSGSYWLCHHTALLEWVWDEDERRKYIDEYKPENERAIRQLCFQPVKGELPKEIIAAVKVVESANKACQNYKVELEAQFAQEYPEAAKHWNGKEIVFPEVKE